MGDRYVSTALHFVAVCDLKKMFPIKFMALPVVMARNTSSANISTAKLSPVQEIQPGDNRVDSQALVTGFHFYPMSEEPQKIYLTEVKNSKHL